METRNWLTKEEAEAFIGKNEYFYLDKWKAHSETALKGWNWAAAFCGFSWMAYRKMYIEILFCHLFLGLFISAIMFFMLLLGIYSTGYDIFIELLQVAFWVCVGAFGNALYRKKALRVLRKTINLEANERLHILREKGGTSVAAVIVLILIELVLAGISIFL